MGATSVDWRAKRQRVKVAKKLLQMFPKYDKKQFANVVTGDETWVHYFEPVRKVSNKIWATKHSKRPIIAKRSLSTYKEGFVCNLLLWWRSRNKSASEKGQKHHRKVLQKRSTEENEKVVSDTTPCHWFKTCPSSTWQCSSSYLRNCYGVFEERKSNCFASPPPPPPPTPYSPDLAPCDFFLFPKLKAFLAGRKYQSRQTLGSAIHQYIITVPKSAYRDAFKKWIHRLKLCISSHGEYFEGMKWVLLG